MKKVLTVCAVVAASLFTANSVNAQQVKIGFFDEQQILAFMPGISKVDTMLQKFATDSLAPERDQLMEDLKKNDSMIKDSAKYSKSLLLKIQKDAAENYYKLQNWQQYQTQVLQQKQEQLLLPFKKPVYAALEEVILEQKYTLVLKPDVLVWADKNQELPLRVLAKLKLPNLPKEVQDQINALGATKSTTPQNATPAPKTGGATTPKKGGKG